MDDTWSMIWVRDRDDVIYCLKDKNVSNMRRPLINFNLPVKVQSHYSPYYLSTSQVTLVDRL